LKYPLHIAVSGSRSLIAGFGGSYKPLSRVQDGAFVIIAGIWFFVSRGKSESHHLGIQERRRVGETEV